jgi:hypothetical protein
VDVSLSLNICLVVQIWVGILVVLRDNMRYMHFLDSQDLGWDFDVGSFSAFMSFAEAIYFDLC